MAKTEEEMAILITEAIQTALARQYNEQIVGNPEVVKTYERLRNAAIDVSNVVMDQIRALETDYNTKLNQNFGAFYIMDTSEGSNRTVTLPTVPTANQVVTVIDAKHTFGETSGSCSIVGGPKRIMGSGDPFVCSTNGMRVELIFIDEAYGWTVSGIYGAVYN